MDIKMPKKTPLIIYEEKELGILVAIETTELTKINEYRKSKGKGAVNTVSGFPFVQCDEQESLKIDFDQKNEYLIDNLEKFN
jgi:hypothetical protein